MARADATTYPPADVEALDRVWTKPTGIIGFLRTVNNNSIGARYLITAFAFLLLGGINAILMRTQLMEPQNDFLPPHLYNQVFTMHGTTMMFLFAVPMLEAFAIYFLPALLGTRDLPFPRLSALSYWTFLFGGIFLYSSFLFGVAPDGGWFAYVPLTGIEYSPGLNLDFWLLGLSLVEVGAIAAVAEIIISVLHMRGPGMALHRIPVFAWSMLVTGLMILFGFTPLLVGGVFLEIDRKFGTQFYNAAAGGSPLLWQHLFWIFGHPEVYIQLLPAAGIVSMIVPVFARIRLTGYTFIVAAQVIIGIVSFGLWVHHMFTVGLAEITMSLFTATSLVVAIPSGVQVFAWTATIWRGRPIFSTAMLFVIGFLFTFVIGGITGVMVGAVPFDIQVHDTYFVVAHFHYVLVGGVLFPVMAALYYWMPKMSGWLMREGLGKLSFWLMFVGFNVGFFPLHLVGFWGMPRRIYTYTADLGWNTVNFISTMGAYVLALGVLVSVINFFVSAARPKPSGGNPWDADSLEWLGTSPTPARGFVEAPIVRDRHPLWCEDTEETPPPDETTRKVSWAMSQMTQWRSSLVTSVLDARPIEIVRIAGPSIWPLVVGLGLAAVFGALLVDYYLVVGLGVLLSIGGAFGWLRESPSSGDIEGAAEKYGVPVRGSGSPIVDRWTVYFIIAVAAVALGSFIFSDYYLYFVAQEWPIGGLSEPPLVLPVIASILLLGSMVSMALAVRAVRDEDGERLRLMLGVTLGLSALFLILEALSSLGIGYGPTVNAYASAFWVGLAFYAVAFLPAPLALAVPLVRIWRGRPIGRQREFVQNTALYWYFLGLAWVIFFATLYLSPYILP